MVGKILKRVLLIAAGLLLSGVILLVMPRVISSLRPEKPPIGYHFMPAAFISLWLGIEELADLVPAVPGDIEEIKGIEYKNIDGKSLQIDMYRPYNYIPGGPLLLFIHGGGWKSGERSDYLVYLIAFARKGYTTATVSYRLLRDGPYPACVEDIKDALSWVYSNGDKYGYDVSQSDTLKARLDRLGIPSEYYRFPLWPHTMDVVKRVNEYCVVKMEQFFNKYL